MNIKDIIESGAAVTLNVTLADLKEYTLFIINEAQKQKTQDKEDRQLSSADVCGALGVTPGTLWRWEKEGYLMPKRIGRKKFYMQSQLDALTNNNIINR